MKKRYGIWLLILFLFSTISIAGHGQGSTVLNLNSTSKIVPVNNTGNSLSLNQVPRINHGSNMNANITKIGNYFDAINMFTTFRLYNNRTSVTSLIFADMDGEILIEKAIENGGSNLSDMTSEMINSTTVLMSDNNGPYLWNMETDEEIRYNIDGHHEYEFNPNSNTVFTLGRTSLWINGTNYTYDMILESDVNGNIVWQFNTSAWIDPEPLGDSILTDYTHGNSVFYEADLDVIYYNARNINTFYKINHTTGDLIWGLGELGEFDLKNLAGEPTGSMFTQAHAVEPIGNNTFIMMDNGYRDLIDGQLQTTSRLLEIQINEETKEAWESWNWIPPLGYKIPWWGDADKLPNGNRFGTFGTSFKIGFDMGARLPEVDDVGIVWEMNFPTENGFTQAMYRSERISFSPVIFGDQQINVLGNQDAEVSWKTHYNFRSKQTFNGLYEIYLDGLIVDSNSHKFESLWLGTEIVFNFGKLIDGNHNATLLLMDEAGHDTSFYTNIEVGDFIITGVTTMDFERGLNESFTFEGLTPSTLETFIYLNDMFQESFIWAGEAHEFGLWALDAGTYNLRIELFNNSQSIFNETVIINIYPQLAPEFLASPVDFEVARDRLFELTWELFDYSPASYKVYIDENLYLSRNWYNQFATRSTFVSLQLSGFHNVTIVAEDLTGMTTSLELNITVPFESTPLILQEPLELRFEWKSDIDLTWLVTGVTSWELQRNGVSFITGQGVVNKISLPINWFEDEWIPNTYNMSLILFNDDSGISVKYDFQIEIVVKLADFYANSYLPEGTLFVNLADNALGVPDGQYAAIIGYYGLGYITLDMGDNEDINNEIGSDFIVYTTNQGQYEVSAGNNPTTLQKLGRASGIQGFDLSIIGLESARFVRIELVSGLKIELDAIEAIYVSDILNDDSPPIINGPEDHTLFLDQSVNLQWIIDDLTPLRFEVKINNVKVISGLIDDPVIALSFVGSQLGVFQIEMIVTDVFDNFASDIVVIDVIQEPIDSTTTITQVTEINTTTLLTQTTTEPVLTNGNDDSPIDLLFLVLSIMLTIQVFRRVRKKTR
ncbi:MAG: aryl-sulfate sulfotransferase [Candidatus Heimdallarchaeota archaeon]|nr:aryl-sulfate sulfotransferase [Candidatus Heimdallarchaeota archaeon]